MNASPQNSDQSAESSLETLEFAPIQTDTEVQVRRNESRDRLTPLKRGGQPRTSSIETVKPPEHQCKPGPRKPEIVCWKRDREWILAVQVPEELASDPDLTLVQEGSPLIQDELLENCWHLPRTTGQILVSAGQNGATSFDLALGERNCLLFKLGVHDEDQGRRVNYASFGSFLVIAPDDWRRDEDTCGPAPAEPEPVSLPGYTAHFFNLEKAGPSKIAFWGPEGTHRELDSKAPMFELVGNRLSDAHENMGPLFGGGPPRIRSARDGGWQDIQTIVVGEEGGRKWRSAFSPLAGMQEQDLQSTFENKRIGWYFVRLYDLNDDLVESLDFRFASSLKEITVPQPDPFPPTTGHSAVTIEFHHTTDCVVNAESYSSVLSVKQEAGRSIAVIPASPAFDQTYWEFECPPGRSIEVWILVERIWWSRGQEGSQPAQSDWSDQPLKIERDACNATSQAVLYVWVPTPRWADEVLIGAGTEALRSYRIGVNSRYASIPLREVGDAVRVQDGAERAFLKVWIVRGGNVQGGVIVGEVALNARLPAIPQPDRSQKYCSSCDHARHQNKRFWCRRRHWYKVPKEDFDRVYARNWCDEWRGEYQDPEGKWHTK